MVRALVPPIWLGKRLAALGRKLSHDRRSCPVLEFEYTCRGFQRTFREAYGTVKPEPCPRLIVALGTVVMRVFRGDRFEVLRIPSYTDEELREVVVEVLTTREGKSLDLAEYIADAITTYGIESPRAAVRIARASETREDVEDYLGAILRYRGSRPHGSFRRGMVSCRQCLFGFGLGLFSCPLLMVLWDFANASFVRISSSLDLELL